MRDAKTPLVELVKYQRNVNLPNLVNTKEMQSPWKLLYTNEK